MLSMRADCICWSWLQCSVAASVSAFLSSFPFIACTFVWTVQVLVSAPYCCDGLICLCEDLFRPLGPNSQGFLPASPLLYLTVCRYLCAGPEVVLFLGKSLMQRDPTHHVILSILKGFTFSWRSSGCQPSYKLWLVSAGNEQEPLLLVK